MRKLSLIEQARIIKQRREFKRTLNLRPDMNTYERLNILIPYYTAIDKVIRWHNAPQLEKGITGGVRSGKTYTLSAEGIDLSHMNRPYFHLDMSPSQDNADLAVVPVYIELCEQNGLKYDWVSSRRRFYIFHGDKAKDRATIVITGSDNPKLLKGITAASGTLNEPFSQKKESVLIWYERISHPLAILLGWRWGGTAEPEKMAWGHEHFDKLVIDNEELYKITLETYDNKHLDPEYVTKLEKKYDSKRKEVYMRGRNINLSGLGCYHDYDPDKNFIDVLKFKVPKTVTQLGLGFDFNVDPMTATEFCYNDKRAWQVDEYKIESSNTEELCTLIINRMIDKYNGITGDRKFEYSLLIGMDASARQRKPSAKIGITDARIIIRMFEQAGFNVEIKVPETNPPVRDRVNYINTLFKQGIYQITSNCTETDKDFKFTKWKQGASGFAISKTGGYSHLSDSAGYFLWLLRYIFQVYLDDSEDAGSEYIERVR